LRMGTHRPDVRHSRTVVLGYALLHSRRARRSAPRASMHTASSCRHALLQRFRRRRVRDLSGPRASRAGDARTSTVPTTDPAAPPNPLPLLLGLLSSGAGAMKTRVPPSSTVRPSALANFVTGMGSIRPRLFQIDTRLPKPIALTSYVSE